MMGEEKDSRENIGSVKLTNKAQVVINNLEWRFEVETGLDACVAPVVVSSEFCPRVSKRIKLVIAVEAYGVQAMLSFNPAVVSRRSYAYALVLNAHLSGRARPRTASCAVTSPLAAHSSTLCRCLSVSAGAETAMLLPS